MLNVPDILERPSIGKTKEYVAQAYFEIWAIEVGIGEQNNPSVDFEI